MTRRKVTKKLHEIAGKRYCTIRLTETKYSTGEIEIKYESYIADRSWHSASSWDRLYDLLIQEEGGE